MIEELPKLAKIFVRQRNGETFNTHCIVTYHHLICFCSLDGVYFKIGVQTRDHAPSVGVVARSAYCLTWWFTYLQFKDRTVEMEARLRRSCS